MNVKRLISGGQTGVDRAALDVAISVEIPSGGSCPKHRWAEDGVIPARYPLMETSSDNPRVRTEAYVVDSDGTLILTTGEPADGTPFTKGCAIHHGKSLLEVDLDNPPDPGTVREWISRNNIRTLNMAGPRESHRPGFMYRSAFEYLMRVFSVPND
jgi:hypothetical protein